MIAGAEYDAELSASAERYGLAPAGAVSVLETHGQFVPIVEVPEHARRLEWMQQWAEVISQGGRVEMVLGKRQHRDDQLWLNVRWHQDDGSVQIFRAAFSEQRDAGLVRVLRRWAPTDDFGRLLAELVAL
jgi:hypothetical protein